MILSTYNMIVSTRDKGYKNTKMYNAIILPKVMI